MRRADREITLPALVNRRLATMTPGGAVLAPDVAASLTLPPHLNPNQRQGPGARAPGPSRVHLRECPADRIRDIADRIPDIRDRIPGTLNDRLHQLQPLVLPQLGQAWHEPARCIWTPHCMQ
jgi:hypothetical protein